MSPTETDSREEERASQASEEYVDSNPRFHRTGAVSSNPRFADPRDGPDEDPAGQASGYDEVSKSLEEEEARETVAKDAEGFETDDRTEAEFWEDVATSMFADPVSKEAEDLAPIEPITREEMAREWEGISKEATDAEPLDELEAAIEGLPAEVVRMYLALQEMADEEEEESAAELLAQMAVLNPETTSS